MLLGLSVFLMTPAFLCVCLYVHNGASSSNKPITTQPSSSEKIAIPLPPPPDESEISETTSLSKTPQTTYATSQNQEENEDS
ncbi:hypothetical protein TNCV_773841 [Trichonephila clavipes]|nr:hypothetical protein TNCV_773841 [Trichonephila clavipes]